MQNSKRNKDILKSVDTKKEYSILDAVQALKKKVPKLSLLNLLTAR